MQVIILASGKGTRMGNLTEETPKPMLTINGRNLIEHKLAILPEEITEVVLVVGYLGDQIKDFFGDHFAGRPITYVHQPTLRGTGDALWRAQKALKERFLVMMGDDIYHPEDIKECLSHPWSVLVSEVPYLNRGGRVILDETNHLSDIIEGQNHNLKNGLVNTGLYVMNKKIFDYPLVQIKDSTEFGLPQTLLQATSDVDIKIVKSRRWIQITSPDDLTLTESLLKSESINSSIF